MIALHWLYWNSCNKVVKWWHYSFKVTSYVASRCIQELLGAFFNHENWVLNGEQEKNPLASLVMPTMILGTDFPIPTSHSWWILIFFTEQILCDQLLFNSLQTVWTQTRPDKMSGLVRVQTVDTLMVFLKYFFETVNFLVSLFFINLKSLKTVGEAFRSPWKVLELYSYLPVWFLKFWKNKTNKKQQNSW